MASCQIQGQCQALNNNFKILCFFKEFKVPGYPNLLFIHVQASLAQENKSAPCRVASITNMCGILTFWTGRHPSSSLGCDVKFVKSAMPEH